MGKALLLDATNGLCENINYRISPPRYYLQLQAEHIVSKFVSQKIFRSAKQKHHIPSVSTNTTQKELPKTVNSKSGRVIEIVSLLSQLIKQCQGLQQQPVLCPPPRQKRIMRRPRSGQPQPLLQQVRQQSVPQLQ